MPRLPRIALPSYDYPRVERLARVLAEKGDMDAIFLMDEISRAEILPDLSSLGAALLGLRVGDEMPYFVAGCRNLVRVQDVSRSKPT